MVNDTKTILSSYSRGMCSQQAFHWKAEANWIFLMVPTLNCLCNMLQKVYKMTHFDKVVFVLQKKPATPKTTVSAEKKDELEVTKEQEAGKLNHFCTKRVSKGQPVLAGCNM